jgi:ferredoxin-NADP reductase
VLLISAGVGATPVLAMLHALAAGGSHRDIWWLHGARNRADEPFASESQSLLKTLPQSHRQICFSHPGPDDAEGRDYQRTGHLSPSVLAALGLPHDADAYLCGPTGFMADASAALVDIGLVPGRIHTEIFGATPGSTPGIATVPTRAPHQPPSAPDHGPSIAFARSGLTVHWDSTYANLLELAEACDVPVRWSCRTGVCQTCETSLVAGDVTYSPDPIEAPAAGSALICCSQPTGDLALDL